MRGVVGVGDDHGEDKVCRRSVGSEPLVAVDDIFVSVSHSRGRYHRGVGAGVVRFGHGEAAGDLASEQRFKPLLFLLVVGSDGQQLAVARVWGLVAEDDRGYTDTAQNLMHKGQLHLPVALAS